MEPEVTNFAQMRDEPFMGTLDYIFLSPGWQVLDTHRTRTVAQLGSKPLPAGLEPSDHLFLAATVLPPPAQGAGEAQAAVEADKACQI